MMSKILMAMIRFYQWTFSPLLGRHCRFEPSCSHYTLQCIANFGALRGGWLGLKRIARCHPFGASGFDPPPSQVAERAHGKALSPSLCDSPNRSR